MPVLDLMQVIVLMPAFLFLMHVIVLIAGYCVEGMLLCRCAVTMHVLVMVAWHCFDGMLIVMLCAEYDARSCYDGLSLFRCMLLL